MQDHCLLLATVAFLAVQKIPSAAGTEPVAYPLLTPPDYDLRSIMRAFVELQNQWCPPRKYKKLFVLNYNPDQFSEEILTAILRLPEPPKIVSNKPSDITFYTYEIRRCAIMMMRGYERMKPYQPIHYGSRYFIFHPKLQHNAFMEDLDSGAAYILDKAYHIVYNRSAVGIFHKNFFTNRTISLDPLHIRVPDDLKDLHGRKLRLWLADQSHEVTGFDVYLGETIARQRNGSFELEQQVSIETDYGVMHIGVPFLGTDHIVALGSTFVTVLVPRSKPKPVISVLVDPFDYYTWIGLFAMIFALSIVLARFGDFLRRLHPVEVCLELLMCILSGPSRAYGGWLENQLLTTFCLVSIVLVSSYQSLIISYLSVVRYFPEINSAHEIRNRCIFPNDAAFATQLDFEIKSGRRQRLERAVNRDTSDRELCFLFNSRDDPRVTSLLLAHSEHANKAAGAAYRQNLRIADTIFFKFHLLYYFYQKSLIRELFPFFISAFYEGGLFDQYYRNKSLTSHAFKQDLFVNHAFSVADLSVVWCLFLAGTGVSFAGFLLEFLVHYLPARKLRYRLQRCVVRCTDCKSRPRFGET